MRKPEAGWWRLHKALPSLCMNKIVGELVLGNVLRPGDAHLPLVMPQRRSCKGNDGWLWYSKRDLNLMQAGLSPTTTSLWRGLG